MKYRLIILLAISFLIVNCTKMKAEEVDVVIQCEDNVSFAQTIDAKILTPSCNTSGCHNADASGGFNFTTYGAVSANADLIYDVISHAPGAKAMPLGSEKLSDSLISHFRCWIDQGKQDN